MKTHSTTELQQALHDGNWPLISAVALNKYQQEPTKLLQILIFLQQSLGCIPEALQEQIACDINQPRSHIKGVIEFYHFLNEQPIGKFQLFISNNIIDKMQGADQATQWLCSRLQVSLGQPRADGHVYINETSCIGMSDQGPSLLVNGLCIPRLDPSSLEQIASLIEKDQAIEFWPAELFTVTNHIHRKDWFLNSVYLEGESLQNVISAKPVDVLATIEQSGLCGRGGAGFPTAKKWRLCAQAPADQRFVVCNADEGEPGTFKDRVLLTHYAHSVIEGMTLCAHLLGAHKGFIYLRGEYLYLHPALEHVLADRRKKNLLGPCILGQTHFNFDIDIHLGAGAYICGEESALIESLEGKRGIPRKRPPFPVTSGYLGYPTVVNNVETFAMVTNLLSGNNNASFQQLGTKHSKGSKLLSISGDCAHAGIYEFPWGVSIREILLACGAQNTAFVQAGGPAGELLAASQFERTLCYEDVGTGGSFMIFDESRHPFEIIANFTQFFAHESCGFCTPCRVGTQLNQQLFHKISTRGAAPRDLEKLAELNTLMDGFSHCGLGKTASHVIRQGLEHTQTRLIPCSNAWSPDFDINQALQISRTLRAQHTEGND
jgi:[NiFe] hydrogenase diaphorase moiety large subunit